MKDVVKRCLGKVIVSCQAYEDTPLYGSDNMKIMAESVILGGAEAVRSCWAQDIKAIRELSDDLIIVGINKIFPEVLDENSIFITPTLESAAEVIEAGCDILALDCTHKPQRGKEELLELLKSICERYPDIAIMADCATYEECVFAANTGYVDIVATTLSGVNVKRNGPDLELVERLKKDISVPVNAEGNVWEVKDIDNLVKLNADMITIGSAITRPHEITKRFIQQNMKARD